MEMVKWTKILGFHNLRKSVNLLKSRTGRELGALTFRGKVKIDGTNAGVRLPPKGDVLGVQAQSRTQDINPGSDNAAFAAWVAENEEYFENMREKLDLTTVIFGEWCGQGVQKGGAIHQIGRKVFAVFCVEIHQEDKEVRSIVDPNLLTALLPDHPDVYVIPWEGDDITIDFLDAESLEQAVEELNKRVSAVEAEDPFVKSTFDKSGVGEGLVFYPTVTGVLGGAANREEMTKMMFKAKGEKHRVVKQKKAVVVDVAVLASVDAFVETFVTENRCQQALTEACGGEFDRKFTGKFLQWMAKDVLSESADELEASGLTWKQVAKKVQEVSRNWFFQNA